MNPSQIDAACAQHDDEQRHQAEDYGFGRPFGEEEVDYDEDDD